MRIRLTVELSDDDRRLISRDVLGDGTRKADRHVCSDYVLRAVRERLKDDRLFWDGLPSPSIEEGAARPRNADLCECGCTYFWHVGRSHESCSICGCKAFRGAARRHQEGRTT